MKTITEQIIEAYREYICELEGTAANLMSKKKVALRDKIHDAVQQYRKEIKVGFAPPPPPPPSPRRWKEGTDAPKPLKP